MNITRVIFVNFSHDSFFFAWHGYRPVVICWSECQTQTMIVFNALYGYGNLILSVDFHEAVLCFPSSCSSDTQLSKRSASSASSGVADLLVHVKMVQCVECRTPENGL